MKISRLNALLIIGGLIHNFIGYVDTAAGNAKLIHDTI